MNKVAAEKIVKDLALSAGVDPKWFHHWDGRSLKLCRIRGGRSAQAKVAERIAIKNAEEGHWRLVLGGKETSLPKNQGDVLNALLQKDSVTEGSHRFIGEIRIELED